MADTKDQILIDFQAFTGLDDLETCGAILAQHDWNLELAVNSVMHDDSPTDIGPARMSAGTMGHSSESDVPMEDPHSPPPPMDLDASASGPSTSGFGVTGRSAIPVLPARMINFNVEYRNSNIPIVLPDTETVGQIKEMLAAQLNIPSDKQELKGFFKRKIDDSMVLRDLYLPKDNVLYLLTPQLCSPSDSSVPSGSRTPVSHRNDEYKLKVIFHKASKYAVYNLNVKGSRTIGEVKQDLYAIVNVPARLQQWNGLPPTATDDVCICDSGIEYPSSEFEVHEKVSPTSSSHSTRSAKAPQAATVEPMDSDSEEEAIEVEPEEDFFDTNEEMPSSRRQEPLMSPDHTTEMEALEHFSHEFAERYGEIHPVFYIGSLDDAIRDSLQCRATDRKLLALYLHHDSSIQAHLFCSQLLCSETIVNFLSSNFITWAWDLTHPDNMNKLVTSATRHFGSIAANQIRSYKTEQLPALLVISRSKATNEVLDVIQGHTTLNELMTRLLHTVDVFQAQKEADIAEERERMAREQIKQEQDEAYQESLLADRKKAEAARVVYEQQRQEQERQLAIQAEEERKKQEEEAVKEAIKESIAKSVPEEPLQSAPGGEVSRLRFRLPGGEQVTRRFWAHNTLQDVLNYLTSKGFHTEEYKVLTTFPRRDITQLDCSQTLKDAKLFPQDTLILEEKS